MKAAQVASLLAGLATGLGGVHTVAPPLSLPILERQGGDFSQG